MAVAAGVRRAVARLGTTRPGLALRRRLLFRDSGSYWERRYAAGGTSGSGSYGSAAAWKATVVNGWVEEHGVTSVLDLGCGDGNQLSLGQYPRYLGLDRSPTAIRACIRRYASDQSKSFLCYDPRTLKDPAGWLHADLALSMEVLFHLVEDEVFDDYLHRLFDAADRFVAICGTDAWRPQTSPHELHRPFTPWIADHRPQWRLVSEVAPPEEAGLVSSLYLFARDGGPAPGASTLDAPTR